MGLHEGAPYIALEFIDGKDLRRVVARAQERALQLPLSFILYVATRLLDALAYAHRKRGDDGKDLNLVHRDVSPQNILISYEGEVKVIDFGLAKSALSSNRTHPSIVLGKFLYMSPEQARHQKVDRRSDLYAVGLCLYELIAAKNPFDGIAPGELMAAVANPSIAPLSQVEPLCPPSLSEAIMKALAADPTVRFQTAEEFRGKLLSILLEIDPSAGPETATRFMTEAFASEYQAERKLLAELTEQARSLKSVPVVEEPEHPTREVLSAPAMTLDEVPQARVTAPEMKSQPADPPPAAAALSFQPTRKAPPPSEKKSAPEVPSAVPSIVVSEARLTEEVAASIVLGDGLSEAADARARTRPETKARATPPHPKTDPTRKAQARTTSPKLAPKSSSPRLEKVADKKPKLTADDGKRTAQATPAFDDTPAPAEVTGEQTPAPTAAPKKKSSVAVWIALPLLTILAVGSYIAWDLYTEKLRAQQQVDDPNQALPIENARSGSPVPERSREVKVTPDPVEPAVELEDLTALQREPKKQKPRPSETKLSEGDRLLKNLEADAALLINPGDVKGLNIQLVKLRNTAPAQRSEATFTAQVKDLHRQVREALGKQQQ
jgi:serine/threonine-protein kinase